MATAAAGEVRLAAELGRHRYQGGVEQALSVEVLDERGEDAVEIAADVFHAVFQRGVHIPAAMRNLDEAHAVLDEPARQEATLTETRCAVTRLGFGGFGGEVEGLEFRALHELEGGVVEFIVGLDVLVGGLGAEAGVEFSEQLRTLGLDRFIREGLDVLQPVGGRLDRQRRERSREPAVAVVGRTADADRRRQSLAGAAQEVLGPRPEGRVLERAALLEASAHEVGGGSMHADLGGHAADDGDLVGDLHGLGQEGRQLIPGLGRDGRGGPLVGAGLRVEGVDVRHAAGEFDEDDSLGLAEARQAGVRSRARSLRRLRELTEERQDAQAKGDLGAAFDERTAGERIAELVGRNGEAHWMKRNSRVLARAHARSARLRPSDKPLPAAAISRALGRRDR